MLKRWIASAMLSACPIAATTTQTHLQDMTRQLHDESLVLFSIGLGNENLLSQRYLDALADFQRAFEDSSRLRPLPDEVTFLILLGQTVAYDNLLMYRECVESLTSLEELCHDPEESREPAQSYNPRSNDMLLKLVQLTPTPAVQSRLNAIIHQIPHECLPAETQSAAASPLSANPCRSIFKKAGKWLKKVPLVLAWISEVLESKKKLEKALSDDRRATDSDRHRSSGRRHTP